EGHHAVLAELPVAGGGPVLGQVAPRQEIDPLWRGLVLSADGGADQRQEGEPGEEQVASVERTRLHDGLLVQQRWAITLTGSLSRRGRGGQEQTSSLVRPGG